MCTAIAYKGNDLLYGFNMDIDPDVWHYSVHKTKSVFAIGIEVGKTVYYVHGINKNGNFGNVPYMNGERFPAPKGARRERIDLMNDRYIRGVYSFRDIEEILRTKTVVNIPAATMHSLIGSGDGDILIIEPGYGYKRIEENYAVLTNFPVFSALSDYKAEYFGKDRYDKAVSVLKGAGQNFSKEDALSLLSNTTQKGKWATRISFLYSANDSAVYYFINGDISNIEIHKF